MDSQTKLSSSTTPQHKDNLIDITKQFVWPEEDLARAEDDLNEPLIDLESYFSGGDRAKTATEMVRAACVSQGLFQVVNHGVDLELIRAARDCAVAFFELPVAEKAKAERKAGSTSGYSSALAERFTSKLPWKETLTVGFHERCCGPVEFFRSSLGTSDEHIGLVFQKYCEAMKELSMIIIEILGTSLGVNPSYYKDYFEEGFSTMRCNFYPPCQKPELTLGTGPHRDTNSITILHQHHVAGLQVFADTKWKLVRPRNDALVIAIGDTFQAFTNNIFKSCLHRAVVNNHQNRLTLAFFVSPKEDKVIVAPEDLITSEKPRLYPNFMWSDMLLFIQNHYRADGETLHNFCKWFQST
ncbi:unnamed protein product [Cuscuta epithymum]|uniref:feruloyl-CoA 6-hydroxylase n=1 Tax=Cuscuta epithymum TaxID=186058 RepID=A0AAV0FL65_9ASTE|nr:unnamed protein product [Cuscuta epithymum]